MGRFKLDVKRTSFLENGFKTQRQPEAKGIGKTFRKRPRDHLGNWIKQVSSSSRALDFMAFLGQCSLVKSRPPSQAGRIPPFLRLLFGL